MSSFPIQNSELLARLKPFGISFEKSLTDLIKGIRAHSKDSPESLLTFLNNAIQECREELATNDLEIKTTAVLKLAYLEMYGFDMSWCNFHILEVMSSSKFQQKRIGYLAAGQSFKSEQELLILATNQFKKDLNSHNHVEVGLALSGIATIVTPNLAKDLVDDILVKLTHSKPYIRKKAVLALFKIFLQYPESWKSSLPRVLEKLDDPDISVVSATITVICEISKKHPKIFLNHLPKFFSILEDTTNNWLIIRILKLFSSLSKIEPRMKKRIMPSIVALMSKTEATSLIYESINCIVDGGMISSESSRDKEVAETCVDHIMDFSVNGDANLRFVGLLALVKILHIFPSFIHKKEEVYRMLNYSLKVDDLIIKRKALEMCHYMVTEDNIADLVKTLLLQILPENTADFCPESYKWEITNKILQIASMDNYSHIPNFKWYVTALKELMTLTVLAEASSMFDAGRIFLSPKYSSMISAELGKEFKTLSLKVPSIRSFIMTRIVVEYVGNLKLLQTCPNLMGDLYWIMGEYVDDLGYIQNESEVDELDLATALSQKVTIFNTLVNNYVDQRLDSGTHFPISKELVDSQEPEILTNLIDAVIKLFNSIITNYQDLYSRTGKLPHDKYNELGYFLLKLVQLLENWSSHCSYEVQERCLSWLDFLKLCYDAMDISDSEGVKKLENEELDYYRELFSKNGRQDDVSEESEDSSSQSSQDDFSDTSENDEDLESKEEYDEERQRTDPVAHKKHENARDADRESGDGIDDADIMKVSSACSSFSGGETNGIEPQELEVQLPALLSDVLPSFFKSYQLAPVSASAQRRVPLPDNIDLNSVINTPSDNWLQEIKAPIEFETSDEPESDSAKEELDLDLIAKERSERLRDDPYYITSSGRKKQSRSTQDVSALIQAPNSEVPSEEASLIDLSDKSSDKPKKSRKLKKEKVVILGDNGSDTESKTSLANGASDEKRKKRRNKLIIDSMNLDRFDFESHSASNDNLNKDYVYDVDLEAMRIKIAEKEKKIKIKKEKKDKEKRSKKEKISKPELSDKKSWNTDEILPESSVNQHQNGEGSAVVSKSTPIVESVTEQVPTVPAKSKKKKKRAMILD